MSTPRTAPPAGRRARLRRPLPRRAGALLATGALAATLGLAGPAASPAAAAVVPVGSGSYSDTRPPGASGPSDNTGAPVTPKVTPAAADRPVPTNDWWSSLAFQRYPDNPYSTPMYGHPLTYQATSAGLDIGYPTTPAITGEGRQYEYAHQRDLTLGLTGLNSPDTKADDWSDWTVTPYWADGTRTLRTTIGHGLPFVYAKGSGGDAQVTTAAPPTVFADRGSVLGLTVSGHHYALFAPTGSDWNVRGRTVTAGLGAQDYFSVAVLPDQSALDTYERYAYSFVTGSRVDWAYDGGTVRATYSLTTEPQEGTETGTLQALYRHQWLNTTDQLTPYTYVSPRGTMKVVENTSFTTSQRAAGVLPALPESSGVDADRLRGYLADVVGAGDPFSGATDTYWTGKALGRLAQLVPVAEQIGETGIRDELLGLLKGRLQEWFSAGGEAGFSYDSAWRTLTGYPASYGSDTELNDHHFHYSYFVYAAAVVAQYDPAWAAESAWGGMVEMLVRDAANPARGESAFPFLRGFDVYAGHSWASGHQGFAAGNNQESSSESANLSAGLVLWGSATGDTALRDLGLYLLTTESEAISQYWFDADQDVFPDTFTHDTAGMVWGSGAAYATWWTANPEEIHGINVLPVTGGSLHLGARPDAIRRNLDEMERENGGPAVEWRDILWEFESLADPASAKAKWDAGHSAYTPEAGESKAHTYHWLATLDALGAPDTAVTGDLPTSAVFDDGSVRTYAAHNHGTSPVTVTFSDGVQLAVPARSTATTTGDGGPEDPPPATGDTFRLVGGGTLTTATDTAAGSDTIASADGGNHDGTPYQPLVYEAHGVNGTLRSGSSTAFTLPVDAGTTVALGQQARVSYDLTGDGTFERTETYHYFATDPVPGWEEYTQARGLKSATGSLGDLRDGTIRLEVWSAIGNGSAQLETGTDRSVLVIPYD
ncbi:MULTISPECIES: glycosyl hydrolase [unclassified Streptomyces]|uniref:glycosyl hydrolase n=1 Tax=unclassified Streptomyces TaxID=2593676 RepID=UPI0022B6A20F|nr:MULTISPECIES: glycosyl hydrolase [unclassified Streptomyces]MCZ7413439.1 glycosyl hydrolase [Streptomyces sp. WMMC897]MCZ7430433.1 glycosyl hydrolase [Streptomyces sp. WMMC1477]